MGRRPKPWWRESCQAYYAMVNGKQRYLATNRRDADTELKRILQEEQSKGKVSIESVAAVLDDFLDWTKENRAPKTYEGYKAFCQSFIDKYGRVRVSDLTTDMVTKWLTGKTTWNSTTKRDAITCLQRGFNWAKRNRGLKYNPIQGMEKPEAQTRTAVVAPAEFGAILVKVKDQAFRDLLIVSYDSGCRPQEVKRLEARHVQIDKQRAVLPTPEAKGRRRVRTVYFPTERSMEIIKRLMKAHPEGKLFLNTWGNPWTASAVKIRFEHLEEKLGKRYRQYDFRHTWITRQLVAGVDSHVVATLAGHADTNMIHKVYSAIADDHKFLLEQAKKGAGASGAGE